MIRCANSLPLPTSNSSTNSFVSEILFSIFSRYKAGLYDFIVHSYNVYTESISVFNMYIEISFQNVAVNIIFHLYSHFNSSKFYNGYAGI